MKRRGFLWTDWNTAHVAKHDVTRAEAEEVVLSARPPYPRDAGDGKQLVHGQTRAGRYLQVIFVIASPGRFDFAALDIEQILLLSDEQLPPWFVIHARDLTEREKSKHRKRRT